MAANQSTGARFNLWLLGLTRNWMRVVLIVIFLYVGLPFAAPTLMHFGATGPANAIYTIYSPLCHQFAFRSWFLFGEQTAYPRAEANIPGLKPYEAYSDEVISGGRYALSDPTQPPRTLADWTRSLIEISKGFVGDARMGYKVALCERDVAIYGALFIGGLIYAIPYVRRRLRPVPLWLYVLLGVLPIAIDGFSQLLSEPPFSLWPMRETSPFFRTVTGALFGLMNAWLAFPYLEESMRQTAAQIKAKFAASGD